jgi:diguanylate cyclase (GGDEF)-like protein
VTVPAWSTQHLAEFLAALSACDTQQRAIAIAVERIAESFDAEICAYRSGDTVAAAVGFPAGRTPVEALLHAGDNGASTVVLPGFGECTAVAVPVAGQRGAAIIVARVDVAITPEESSMLRGMARVLGLTLEMLAALDRERAVRVRQEEQGRENQRLLVSVQKRQSLLERLSGVQRAILLQSPVEEVLALITEGVAMLLDEQVVGLRLTDPHDPELMTLVAHRGLPDDVSLSLERTSVHTGTGGAAITGGRLVVSHDYANDTQALPAVVSQGIVAAMAAPVRENGRVVGSLVVASPKPGRHFESYDEDILSAFADHVSLALTDARTRDDMRHALEDAIHQALHDPLTGLPNRSLFVDRLAQSLGRVRAGGPNLAVLFVDLDNFKMINDSSGHATGDKLLAAVGARITECFRSIDTVARFGGDEFAIVVEGIIDGAQADAAAARLLDALTAPLRVGDDRFSVGASIGVVVGKAGDRPEELLLNADVAMYHAKALGKGRWSVFRPEMHSSLMERIEMEAALRAAIECDQLHLAYQPIVDLRTGATVGAEALLRWTHPTRGVIPPAEFIPLAEETGLIVEIGRWVLERACRDASGWVVPTRPTAPLHLSVNLSAGQMQDVGLVSHLRQVLAENAFPASRLTLEITESVLIDDAEMAAERLGELKSTGVRLALDDFGTGYSSLSYLRRFPIDIVKIDKSFIDGLVTDSGDDKLVEAIVNLSQALSLETTAEGVETAAQHSRLLEMGCELGQGFHFARPMSSSDLDARLAAEAGVVADWLRVERQTLASRG